MTIAFPRELFGVRYTQAVFELSYNMALNRNGAGMIEAVELGDAIWQATFTTEPLTWSQRAALSAWAASLRGGLQTFLGYDPFRQWPAAYRTKAAVLALTRAGGGAFDGTATLSAIATNNATLGGLPAGYQASVGDMVSLPRPNKQRSLHNLVEAVTANGSGQATLNLEPAVPADCVTSSPDVRLVKAPAVMLLNWDSLKPSAGVGRQSATFTATQTTVPQP
jgi:hypothetical protein